MTTNWLFVYHCSRGTESWHALVISWPIPSPEWACADGACDPPLCWACAYIFHPLTYPFVLSPEHFAAVLAECNFISCHLTIHFTYIFVALHATYSWPPQLRQRCLVIKVHHCTDGGALPSLASNARFRRGNFILYSIALLRFPLFLSPCIFDTGLIGIVNVPVELL